MSAAASPAVRLPVQPGPATPGRPPHAVHATPTVAVTRGPGGWTVVCPAGAERVANLLEGLSLADLVAEEYGLPIEPDRTTRRSARGPAAGATDAAADPRDVRLAELERTVAQLEHALAARVSTERAIGVLAERNGTTPREAFEALRKAARSQGRAVTELAREVLDGLADRPPSSISGAADGAETAAVRAADAGR